MSTYTLNDVASDLSAMLHGTDLSQIESLRGLYNRSARQLLLDVNPQETKRIVQTTTPIYNQVYDYALPADLKGNKIIDIFPQVNRTGRDIYLQDFNQAFDVTKIWTNQDQFSILFNTGIKTIRIAAPTLQAPVQINQASQITSNGTWVVGGDATNLRIDNVNYLVGGSSLMFDLPAAGSSGYLENSTMDTVNLTEWVNQATNFLYTYFPTGSVFSSVNFRLGSDNANYYSLTATLNQQNTAFINGWNQMQYVWSSMTQTGTPDTDNLNYVRVTWAYDGTAQTGVKLNDIFSALGTILNVEYYSKYLFSNALTGAWQETVLDDSDFVNLDTESYNLFLYQCAIQAVQQQQGLDAMFYDGNYFGNLYQHELQRYKAMYKSEVQLPRSTYYLKPNPSYTQSRRARIV